MAADSLYTLQIMLPTMLDRRFARWAAGMPGASWPSSGGHITLLSPFTLEADKREARAGEINAAELLELVQTVAARHHSIDVHLTQLAVVQDWTREHYRAVFLMPPDEPGSGLQRLLALHRDLDATLQPGRADLYPEIVRRGYLPHLTLALGVSEAEAHSMAGAARADGLSAEFLIDNIWLKQSETLSSGEATTRVTPVALV